LIIIKCHDCWLPAEGALIAASSISLRTSSVIAPAEYLRILLLENNAYIASMSCSPLKKILFISIAKSCPVAYRAGTGLDYNEETLDLSHILLRRRYD